MKTTDSEHDELNGSLPRPRMVKSQLLAKHTHECPSRPTIHIWRRGDNYIARGRLDGRDFGETLGSDMASAEQRLLLLLSDIARGCYTRPTDAKRRLLKKQSVPTLTLHELVGDFIEEIRKLKGRKTAKTYLSRLRPALQFLEIPENRRRWKLAVDLNREFAIDYRTFLFQRTVTRNGRPGGVKKPIEPGHIRNLMECLRSALAWAIRPDVGRLPLSWFIPITDDILPPKPIKDPLRSDPLPLEVKISLIAKMDWWQLCHLGLLFVLPMRPDEFAGLLISDVKLNQRHLTVGYRSNLANSTKSGTQFVMPYPPQFDPIVKQLFGERAEGPLFRSRKEFDGPRFSDLNSLNDLEDMYRQEITNSRDANTEQDRKFIFRRLLVNKIGGVSPDRLAKEFSALCRKIPSVKTVELYDLRRSITNDMKESGMPHLDLRYLTSHSVDDILNDYATINPDSAMRRYFETIEVVLDALRQRANELGIE